MSHAGFQKWETFISGHFGMTLELEVLFDGHNLTCFSLESGRKILMRGTLTGTIESRALSIVLDNSAILFGPNVESSLCSMTPSFIMVHDSRGQTCSPFCQVPATCQYKGWEPVQAKTKHWFQCDCPGPICDEIFMVLESATLEGEMLSLCEVMLEQTVPRNILRRTWQMTPRSPEPPEDPAPHETSSFVTSVSPVSIPTYLPPGVETTTPPTTDALPSPQTSRSDDKEFSTIKPQQASGLDYDIISTSQLPATKSPTPFTSTSISSDQASSTDLSTNPSPDHSGQGSDSLSPLPSNPSPEPSDSSDESSTYQQVTSTTSLPVSQSTSHIGSNSKSTLSLSTDPSKFTKSEQTANLVITPSTQSPDHINPTPTPSTSLTPETSSSRRLSTSQPPEPDPPLTTTLNDNVPSQTPPPSSSDSCSSFDWQCRWNNWWNGRG